MRREYKIIYKREGGKRQYKSFQLFPNALRFVRALRTELRPDLKPIVHIQCVMRNTSPWHPCRTPELDALTVTEEKLSDPASMIK